ncbi:MAG: helix-turn-helix domain-containing protein [Bacteroides sp.]|jgi:AraC-like DNA-binding protein|nr:helix-turn-helix domain-containing protein [Bacteroides sp.]
MERFNIIQPSTVLSPYVKHYWLLESDDVINSQRVIPSGNIELLFHRGCPMKRDGQIIPVTSLSGQSLSFADLKPTGTVNMIAIVFHPFGAKAFIELPIYALSNLIVSADDLNISSLKDLEDQILNTVDDNNCIRLIESFLISRLNPFKEYNYKRMVAAVNAINFSNGELSVSHLAETVALSKKQFQRIFSEHVGATPKEFMRIVRFHKALYTLQNNPTMNFTTLAYECGYYDQAHMTNEFKLFSGYTPTQYIAVCAPYSDYFSY